VNRQDGFRHWNIKLFEYIPEFLRGFISLEKSVGSGSELSGLKTIEAVPKLKPGLADSQLHHPLDEQSPDADLHMNFHVAIPVFALGGSEIHAY
jgi:hypothetical protein